MNLPLHRLRCKPLHEVGNLVLSRLDLRPYMLWADNQGANNSEGHQSEEEHDCDEDWIFESAVH